MTKWTAVDLFCGSGAATEGLRRGRFEVVAAIDIDPVACRTYRANHPNVKLYENDIRKVPAKWIAKNDLKGKRLDLLIVCAPCQPFSSQNRRRSPDDHRASLILESVRFVRVLKPKFVFYENVPGLTSARNKELIDRLAARLRKLHYTISEPEPTNVADFGIPQRRQRCIMFAAALNQTLPDIAVLASNLGRTTVRDAVGDLPSLKSGESDPSDKLHFARTHQPIALRRMAHIPKDGGSRSSLPDELALACHKGKKNCYPDVYGRMAWDEVAPTLTTGCTDITRGRFMHPEDDRAITLREAARLQSFPDTYIFNGSAKDIATQIGNALPAAFIEAIMPAVEAELKKSEKLRRDRGG